MKKKDLIYIKDGFEVILLLLRAERWVSMQRLAGVFLVREVVWGVALKWESSWLKFEELKKLEHSEESRQTDMR